MVHFHSDGAGVHGWDGALLMASTPTGRGLSSSPLSYEALCAVAPAASCLAAPTLLVVLVDLDLLARVRSSPPVGSPSSCCQLRLPGIPPSFPASSLSPAASPWCLALVLVHLCVCALSTGSRFDPFSQPQCLAQCHAQGV